MREFDFETAPELPATLVPRAEPELLLPTDFDTRVGKLRAEIALLLRHAEPLLREQLAGMEQCDQAIEAGRLLQAMAKNVAEFYKPIKQRIDLLKQPILDMEHEDAESLQTAKERLGAAVQDFEERQAEAEALRLERNQAAAALDGVEGELPLPAIVAATVPAKRSGKVKRATWHAEVVDFLKLIKAVAAGQELTTALLPNESYLNKRADSDREGMSIPGVEAREVKKVHFRM